MRPVISLLAAAVLLCAHGILHAETASAPRAPVADHHQHLFSPTMLADFNTPKDGPKPILASDVVALMDLAGIRRAAVLSVAYMYGSPKRTVADEYTKVKAENDWNAAQSALYPDRLKPVCGVNPLKPYALDEVVRCAKDPRQARMIKLHFGNSDVQVDNPVHLARMQHFFRTANKNGMGLLIHMRASISLKRPYGAPQAKIFLEQLLPLVPDVPVQLAHMSGTGPGYDDPPSDEAMAFMAEAVGKRDPRTRKVWFDVASVADRDISPANAAKLVQRLRTAGLDRILYGTDAATGDNLRPFDSWAAFRKLPLTEAEFAKIAGNVAPYLK
jgi:predicted TIM-barrel fold metal-dependent hydrolase